ncbi:hypothetical protein OsI_04896 [Oryza sativa Indica Group]|uniref:Uncharacterized protein n=1 Tax=Oryza sativa subsp. indica TaxID=39946 RepID=A2WY92_ORYSI|nr:hypothetical protein OsI_04896 [Oryza sativa Indica Group]
MEALDDCKWRQIPAFGDWNIWDDMPVTQYFESGTFFFTAQAEKDEDLFKVPQFPANPYNYKKALDDCKWRQIPAFGDWNIWDDMPVTQYFESGTFFFTAQAEKDEDLFKVPQFPANPYNYKKCVVRVKGEKENANANANAVRVRKGGRKQQYLNEQQKWKPKTAVDEDLYKISPKLICRVKKAKEVAEEFARRVPWRELHRLKNN